MSGFKNIAAMVNAQDNGQTRLSTWRKSPTQTTTIGIWFDLSMSPGNPVPQYYIGSIGEATPMSSSNGGLHHAGAVSPYLKYVRKIMALTAVTTALPMPMMLCDYLMFYPFIDESTTDEQTLVNTETLPRYTDGDGVQIMAVSVASRIGAQSFSVNYTNSEGVSGRISETVIQNSVSVNGSIVTSDRAVALARGPFIPLQTGDNGVRSIESVTMAGADVGLFTLVLVKPLAQMQIRGIDAPVEADYFKDFSQCPKIEDGAYLNFLCCPAGSLAATPIHGTIETVWN